MEVTKFQQEMETEVFQTKSKGNILMIASVPEGSPKTVKKHMVQQ